MSRAELGVKRRCLSCNKAFFDLNRAPPVCPNCQTVFEVIEIAHSRPRRPPFDPDRTPRQDAVENDADADPVSDEEAPSLSEEQDLDEENVLPPLDDEDEAILPDPDL
ncbi:TIGR02300 family protein [Methylocystis heyeri]|uniref:TIGR02300 family protein n=1 Tax=Methylocystis heyeri TaxID=391905 RepID=A0A6B8KCP9_9HYPH|nr:TIGR02300 family protein [Methylocystis heyeri]QGM45459.1 TIGR02300 family protein [Methylocystis heyeri]